MPVSTGVSCELRWHTNSCRHNVNVGNTGSWQLREALWRLLRVHAGRGERCKQPEDLLGTTKPCRTHWQGNNTARRCWYKVQRTHRGGVQHRGCITTATAAVASCQQKTTTLRNRQWIWTWCPNNLLTLLFVAKGCSGKYYYCCCCCCCCCCSSCWWWLNAIV